MLTTGHLKEWNYELGGSKDIQRGDLVTCGDVRFPEPSPFLYAVRIHDHKLASYPVPRPAGRAWYISSREHDVIDKLLNFQNEGATFCVLFNHLHVQC